MLVLRGESVVEIYDRLEVKGKDDSSGLAIAGSTLASSIASLRLFFCRSCHIEKSRDIIMPN